MGDDLGSRLDDALRGALARSASTLAVGELHDRVRDVVAAGLRKEVGWRAAVNAPDRVTSYAGSAGPAVDVDIGLRGRLIGRLAGVVIVSRGDAAQALVRAAASLRVDAPVAYVVVGASPADFSGSHLAGPLAPGIVATRKRVPDWSPCSDMQGCPIPARLSVGLVGNTPGMNSGEAWRAYRVEIPDGTADLEP